MATDIHKTVIVTGGSQGIGAGLVKAFLGRCYNVVATSRSITKTGGFELGINLSAPPEPFGTYKEAVQMGNLLFLTGMLPTEGRDAKFVGRVGADFPLFVVSFRRGGRLFCIRRSCIGRLFARLGRGLLVGSGRRPRKPSRRVGPSLPAVAPRSPARAGAA